MSMNVHPNDITVFQVMYNIPASPAAGDPHTEIFDMPSLEILSVNFTFTTLAGGGNRYPLVRFSDGVFGILWNIGSQVAIGGGVTHQYNFIHGCSLTPAILNPSGISTYGFGTNLIAPLQPVLVIDVTGMVATDQISGISIVYALWPNPLFPAV